MRLNFLDHRGACRRLSDGGKAATRVLLRTSTNTGISNTHSHSDNYQEQTRWLGNPAPGQLPDDATSRSPPRRFLTTEPTFRRRILLDSAPSQIQQLADLKVTCEGQPTHALNQNQLCSKRLNTPAGEKLRSFSAQNHRAIRCGIRLAKQKKAARVAPL